jgi:hypothetical protein
MCFRGKIVDLLDVQDCRRGWLFGYHWCGGHGCGGGFLRRFNFCFTFSLAATVTEMRPDFVREVIIKRTGVRFLVRDALFGQVFDNYITLHFQFTCQFVNPNLPHA